jgi:hypothetical protein
MTTPKQRRLYALRHSANIESSGAVQRAVRVMDKSANCSSKQDGTLVHTALKRKELFAALHGADLNYEPIPADQ